MYIYILYLVSYSRDYAYIYLYNKIKSNNEPNITLLHHSTKVSCTRNKQEQT